MRRQALRVARLAIGSILLVIGFVGGFIPILQGWMFVLAGLTIMAPESATARGLLEHAKNRFRRRGRGARADQRENQGD